MQVPRSRWKPLGQRVSARPQAVCADFSGARRRERPAGGRQAQSAGLFPEPGLLRRRRGFPHECRRRTIWKPSIRDIEGRAVSSWCMSHVTGNQVFPDKYNPRAHVHPARQHLTCATAATARRSAARTKKTSPICIKPTVSGMSKVTITVDRNYQGKAGPGRGHGEYRRRARNGWSTILRSTAS